MKAKIKVVLTSKQYDLLLVAHLLDEPTNDPALTKFKLVDAKGNITKAGIKLIHARTQAKYKDVWV